MISLYDLVEASSGQLFGEPGAQLFSNFCFDARLATESSLYVALQPERNDLAEAVQQGAAGVLCSRPPEFDTDGLSVILVRDPGVALMQWSRYVVGKLKPQVIGVTGTFGKSITVEAISRVLQTRFPLQKSSPDASGRFSLPLTLAKLSPKDRLVVLEYSATRRGEMLEMVQAVPPHVGAITRSNFSDRDESGDRLVQEDSLLIERLPTSGLAVLNYDDERTRAMAGRTHAPVCTVGLTGFGADLTAYNIVLGASQTGFDVRYGENRYVARWTPLLGSQQLYAVLMGLAVGLHYDIAPEEALKALTTLAPLPGRMNPLNGSGDALLIDDTYNADPEATLSALDWLHTVAEDKHRAIFIFGGMDNLGDYNPRGHRAVGQHAADRVDLFVTIGVDAALAGRAALDQGMDSRKVRIMHSLEDAAAELKERNSLTSNDIVLIKGGASARAELVTRALLADEADTVKLPRSHLITEADLLVRPARSSWVDIDLNALATNVHGLKVLVGKSVTLIAVVKANAYGHGAVPVAQTALLNGAGHLAVASMAEALELRSAGIDAPILVMSYTPPQMIRQAVRENVTITVYDLDLARAYDRSASEAGGKLRVHVKVDTGMGRLGVLAADAAPFFRALVSLSNLEIEGIYTHFSMADEDPDYTLQQVKTFKQILSPLRAAGMRFKYVHAANSAGTLISKQTHFNAVRVGLAMYGLSPSELVRVPDSFRPVLSWKTVIAQVKTLPAGHPVGYGATYVSQQDERVAVIPVGYADGLRRAPQYWGYVLVRGQIAPIIGRVSMEKTSINVTHIPDVQIGDEVVLIGSQGDQTISADDIARRLGTISYEVLCGIVPRAPRG